MGANVSEPKAATVASSSKLRGLLAKKIGKFAGDPTVVAKNLGIDDGGGMARSKLGRGPEIQGESGLEKLQSGPPAFTLCCGQRVEK